MVVQIYWQSKHQQKVDFIVGDEVAIEVKSSQHIQEKHLKGLKVFAEEGICEQYYLISQDRINKKFGDVNVIY